MDDYKSVVSNIKSQSLAHVIVFNGYSNLGYANPDEVLAAQYQEMKTQAEQLRRLAVAMGLESAPLYVVAGAIADGIGMCYDAADKLKAEGFNIITVGIVSSAATVQKSWGKALPDAQAARLDHLIVVDDPGHTWKVLNEKGLSLMVDIAFAARESTYSFYGGGDVANSELVELVNRLDQQSNVNVIVRHGEGAFAPHAEKADKKFKQVHGESIAKGMSDADATQQANLKINGTKPYQQGPSFRDSW